MNQTKIKNIKDIEGFCKLFKINIPVNEDFDYYISTLKRSYEYGPMHKLDEDIKVFCELEQFVKDNNIESVSKYKMKELDRIVEFLQNTQAYKSLMESELPKNKLYTKDLINTVEDGEFLISLDFQSANYNVLKTFDSLEKPELADSWKALCEQLDVHPCLVRSKSFRQIVFGNTNPKRLQTFQHENTLKIVDHLKLNGYVEEDFVFIAHDEIVLKIKGTSAAFKLFDSSDILSLTANGMPLKFTIFSMRKVKKNVFIKSVYSIALGSNNFNTDDKYYFQEEYKTLHGVPGHKFYMYFKQYILNEVPEDRDLVYFNDGELCSWVVQEEKSKKAKLPHYDRPARVLSTESAKVSYPHLWSEMSIVLPNLSDEEKRRVIEVVANTCKYCYESPLGCQCWNDK